MKQGADRRPELFLELNGDRIGKPLGLPVPSLMRGEDADGEFPVRVVPVAAPVPSQDGGSDPGHLEQFRQPAASAEVGEEPVPLGIDVRSDVVRDLVR